MKKLLFLCLLSFTMLQSCTQDELDVAPKQVSTPEVNIQGAVDDMQEFDFSMFKALLLKPVDNDPNTNLTTVFIADIQGNITPVIENFEVRRIEAAMNGLYIETNYMENGSAIAFFVKPDYTWMQVENAGEYIAEDGDGDLLFENGTLKTSGELKMESGMNTIASYSGQLMLVYKADGNRRIVNYVTGVGHDVYGGCDNSTFLASMSNNTIALVSDCGSQYEAVSMKTGESVWVEYAAIFEPTTLVVLENGLFAINKEWVPQSSPDYTPDDERVSWVTFNLDAAGNISMNVSHEDYTGQTTPEAYVAPVVDTDLMKMLNVSHLTTYKMTGNHIYYSGTRNGQPVSGVYDTVAQQDIFVVNDSFTTIIPL